MEILIGIGFYGFAIAYVLWIIIVPFIPYRVNTDKGPT